MFDVRPYAYSGVSLFVKRLWIKIQNSSFFPDKTAADSRRRWVFGCKKMSHMLSNYWTKPRWGRLCSPTASTAQSLEVLGRARRVIDPQPMEWLGPPAHLWVWACRCRQKSFAASGNWTCVWSGRVRLLPTRLTDLGLLSYTRVYLVLRRLRNLQPCSNTIP